jgi:CBS domain-containing protein
MTRQVVTVDPDADLAFVADLLDRRKLKRLPVVKDGRLVGILTRGDMVRALVMSQSALKTPVPRDASELVQSINERMRHAKWLDSSLVSVSVKDGVAELTGLVASIDQRRALRVLVEDTPGVIRVDDKMHVKPAAPMI